MDSRTDPTPGPSIIDDARTTLRSWTQADLRHDDTTTPVRFAPAPCGRLVISVSAAMLEALDCAMAIPDEANPAIELGVTLSPFEAIGGAESNSDRWKIYHGTPPWGSWALAEIDMARFRGAIIDGEAFHLANPLAAIEPRVCGLLNREHHALVSKTISRRLDIEAADPRVVGIDPMGLDVRHTFDVVRIAFESPLTDPATAADAILSFVSD